MTDTVRSVKKQKGCWVLTHWEQRREKTSIIHSEYFDNLRTNCLRYEKTSQRLLQYVFFSGSVVHIIWGLEVTSAFMRRMNGPCSDCSHYFQRDWILPPWRRTEKTVKHQQSQAGISQSPSEKRQRPNGWNGISFPPHGILRMHSWTKLVSDQNSIIHHPGRSFIFDVNIPDSSAYCSNLDRYVTKNKWAMGVRVIFFWLLWCIRVLTCAFTKLLDWNLP